MTLLHDTPTADATTSDEMTPRGRGPRRRWRPRAVRFSRGGTTLALVERLLAAALAGDEPDVPGWAASTRVVDLAVQVGERLREVTTGVAGAAQLLEGASEEMFIKTTELTSACETAVDHALQISAQAAAIADDVESVAERANAFAEQADTVARSSSEAIEVSRQAAEQANASVELGDRLTTSAREIEDVVKIIARIAEQTRLLALNAAIESARAGDAGDGFGVVAKEVKDLATQTQAATAEISARIKQMLLATDESATSFREIAAVVSRVQDLQNTTAETIHQQSALTMSLVAAATTAVGSEQMAASVALATEAVQDCLRTAKELGEHSMRLLGMSSELGRLSGA